MEFVLQTEILGALFRLTVSIQVSIWGVKMVTHLSHFHQIGICQLTYEISDSKVISGLSSIILAIPIPGNTVY